MIPVPAIVYRLLGALLLAGGLFWWGWSKGAQSEQDKQAVAQAKAERVLRATEDGWRAAHWNLAYMNEKKRIERERQVQTDIDGLRTGTLRVRDRLVCPKVPATPGTGPEPDHQASGLLREDAELVLRIAAEADTIADERNQCIESYNALRVTK